MKKNPILYRAGFCGEYSNKILPLPDSNNQAFSIIFSYSSHNCRNHRIARLSAAIEQKNLHECLEILEEFGIASEIALFMLASIQQSLGVAR